MHSYSTRSGARVRCLFCCICAVESVNDYQGRSYLAAPRDESVNLTDPNPPDRCFLPKKLLHSWNVSTKPVNAIRLLPVTGHLVLTCAADAKIKVSP